MLLRGWSSSRPAVGDERHASLGDELSVSQRQGKEARHFLCRPAALLGAALSSHCRSCRGRSEPSVCSHQFAATCEDGRRIAGKGRRGEPPHLKHEAASHISGARHDNRCCSSAQDCGRPSQGQRQSAAHVGVFERVRRRLRVVREQRAFGGGQHALGARRSDQAAEGWPAIEAAGISRQRAARHRRWRADDKGRARRGSGAV